MRLTLKKERVSLLLAILMILTLNNPLPVMAEDGQLGAETIQMLQNRMWDAVIMKADANYAYVRNSKQWLDNVGIAVAYIRNGEALVPIRFLADSLNSRISWNSAESVATLYYMQYEYVFTMGSDIMDIVNPNGNISNPIRMDAATQIIGGRAYIPLREFAQAAGFQYGLGENGIFWFSHTDLFEDIPKHKQIEYKEAVSRLFREEFNRNRTQAVFYVDPADGRDGYDGTITMPFRSIQRAKQAVRSQIAVQGMHGDIIVYLRGGNYYFTEPILFDENDSGQNGYKVIYRAFEGEEPILNGGQRAQGWQVYDGNIYRTFVGRGKNFHTVFENAKFGVKARYPNEGYNSAVAYVDSKGVSRDRFRFNEGDIPKIKDTSELEISKWDGGLSGHQRWFQDIHPVSSLNYNDKVLTFIGNARYQIGTGTEYYIQGALELLDAPGEFYLSKDGYLYYWPNNLPIEEQNIVIPVSNGIINLKGRDENNVVRDISFEGITLRSTDRDGAIRFFAYDNAAIRMDNAAWISFDQIHAYNIASTVCYMGGSRGGWAQNNSFTNSKLHNIGKDGIVMEGISALTSPQAKDEEQNNSIKNRYNVVLNNHIYNIGSVTGHTYPIGMLRSGYNYVAHNRIHDSTRHGICFVDWKPTIFGKTIDGIEINSQNENLHAYTRFNVFEFNEFLRIHTDTQDIGPVYSASTGKNNIIRNNLIYENTIPVSFGFAIYMDSGSHHTYVYDNVIFDNHNIEGKSELRDIIYSKGFNNVVFNNIAADNSTYGFHSSNPHVGVGPNAQVYGNPDQQYDNIVERNVVFNSNTRYIYNPRKATEGAEKLGVNRQENRFKAADFNVFYNTRGEYNVQSLPFESFASWRTWLGGQYDTQTIIGQDPVFMNPQGFDYRFKFDSPVYMQGVRDVNVKDAGLRIENPFRASTDVIDKVFIEVKDKPNNSFVDIKRGETTQLKVTARTENGYMVDMNGAEVQYSIDNSSIAEITNSGIITGKAKGVATLTATVTSNGVQSSTLFHILVDDTYEYKTFKLRLYDTGWEVGMSRPSSAVIKTELGRYIPISGYELTSSNPDIVRIEDNGFVTALAPGTATISANYMLNGVNMSDSINLKIIKSLFNDFRIEAEQNILEVGGSIQININAFGTDGEKYSLEDAGINIITADNEILEVREIEKGVYKLIGVTGGWGEIEVEVTADGISRRHRFVVFVINEAVQSDESWKLSNYSTPASQTTGEGFVDKNGVFNIKSDGENIWDNADRFTFLYKELKLSNPNEKISIYAKLNGWPGADIPKGITVNLSHIGIMIRDKDIPGAKNIALRLQQEGAPHPGIVLVTDRNKQDGVSSFKAGSTNQFPIEIKLVKEGPNIRSFYKGANNEFWKETGITSVEMGEDIMIGILAYSGMKDSEGKKVEAGAYGNVQIQRGEDVKIPDLGKDF